MNTQVLYNFLLYSHSTCMITRYSWEKLQLISVSQLVLRPTLKLGCAQKREYPFLAKIIEPIKLNSLNWFIIFSPFSFLYPVMEQKVSGRKDLLFLCVISFLAVLLN